MLMKQILQKLTLTAKCALHINEQNPILEISNKKTSWTWNHERGVNLGAIQYHDSNIIDG